MQYYHYSWMRDTGGPRGGVRSREARGNLLEDSPSVSKGEHRADTEGSAYLLLVRGWERLRFSLNSLLMY